MIRSEMPNRPRSRHGLASPRSTWLTTTLVLLASVMVGCGPDGAPKAQRALLETHVPRIKEIVREDRERTRAGVIALAERLAPGFLIRDPESQERQMRRHLRSATRPPRGIPELMISPVALIATINADGVVICRNGPEEQDRIKGQSYGERYAVVRRALEGHVGYELAEFGTVADAESSFSMLFAAPTRDASGNVTGAVIAGIPLWREAQRISRQIRLEGAEEINAGMILWASLYNGDRMFFSPDAPTEIVGEWPPAEVRSSGLANSPGGFTTEQQFFRLWYGVAVIPLPTLGPDIGLIVYRSEPDE